MRALSRGIVLFLTTFSFAASGPFRVQISPANGTVVSNTTQQLTATGDFLSITGAGGKDLTNAATWRSSNPGVATVSAGLVTPVAPGTVTISADSGPFHGSTTITVVPNLPVSSITITPVNPSVPNGLNQQFTAKATYSDNSTQDVTAATAWGSTSSSTATIDTSGLARPQAPGTTTISASFSGHNDSTVLTVTVPVLTSIQVTPASTAIPYTSSQQFAAIGMFNNGLSQDITATAAWSSSNPAAVSVNSSGVATGLQVGGSATITATQNAIVGTGTVTAVTFSNANLNGRYAFSFHGTDLNSGNLLVAAGSFQTDGQGNLINGLEDLVTSSFPPTISSGQTFSGTYSVGPDGRGSAAITGTFGTTTFNFSLTVNGNSAITQFDQLAVASGTLKKQDPSSFHTSSLNGPFAFSVSGFDEDSTGAVFPLALIGQFNADGAGNVTSGNEDFNDAGTIGSGTLSGSYSVSSNGRGLMTLNDSVGNTLNFALYMVSSNQALFVSLDPAPDMVGSATQQSGNLGNAALQGNYVLSQSGIFSTDSFNMNFKPFAAGGIMNADGAGNISNGVLDANIGGTIADGLAFSGTYSADSSSGRGQTAFTAGTTPLDYVFYQISPTTAYFLYVDSDGVITGTAEQQTPATFTNASLQGNFDLLLSDGTFGTTAVSGQLFSDGSGNLSGTEDQNLFGTLVSNNPLSGTYSIDGTGRGTAAITDQSSNTTSNFHFYLVSGSEVRFVEIDPNSVLFGFGEQQF